MPRSPAERDHAEQDQGDDPKTEHPADEDSDQGGNSALVPIEAQYSQHERHRTACLNDASSKDAAGIASAGLHEDEADEDGGTDSGDDSRRPTEP